MPAISSGKVLVTGATGYAAEWITRKLLQDGFWVRGTVRSESKGTYLKQLHAEYANKFEYTIVEDMTKVGAFDEAVKDVDGIMHVSSPLSVVGDEPQDMIRPAVAGTVNIFESTLKSGDAVKRIVATSSCAAVYSIQEEFRVFNEDDWSQTSLKEVDLKGREAGVDKYRASKIMAERYVWEFMEKHSGKLWFDVVVLNPPAIFGPSAQLNAETSGQLSGSMRAWWDVVSRVYDDQFLTTAGGEWIDVRDVAQAHLLAMKTEAAGGQRIIVASGPYKFQEWVNSARVIHKNFPPGDVSFDATKPSYDYRFDTSKANRLFGIQYRTIEETTKDILAQFSEPEKGWLA